MNAKRTGVYVFLPNPSATNCPLCMTTDIFLLVSLHTNTQWDEDRWECLHCGATWSTKPGIVFENVKGGEK